MNLTWRFETQVPYGRFIAVVSEDGAGYSARIEGKIDANPRRGDSNIVVRVIRDRYYGPKSVAELSLEALRRAVEEKIENDIGPVSKWTAEPG
jgi:predicted Zn-dependent protease